MLKFVPMTLTRDQAEILERGLEILNFQQGINVIALHDFRVYTGTFNDVDNTHLRTINTWSVQKNDLCLIMGTMCSMCYTQSNVSTTNPSMRFRVLVKLLHYQRKTIFDTYVYFIYENIRGIEKWSVMKDTDSIYRDYIMRRSPTPMSTFALSHIQPVTSYTSLRGSAGA